MWLGGGVTFDRATPLDTPLRQLLGVSLLVDGVDLDGEPRLLAVRAHRARGAFAPDRGHGVG